jgi:hypothetical protein
VATFEHENFLPGAREVGGINQTVMSAPDHDDVVFAVTLPQAR